MSSVQIAKDKSHRIIRYILKVGDIDDVVHTFVDLLGMKVLNHDEFDVGSPDGNEVHYDGPWSRTIIGYSDEDIDIIGPPCLQITINYGVEKYARGNFLDAIELQVKTPILNRLNDAGIPTNTYHGRVAYWMMCDGYRIQVVKSPDNENRISSIVLNCREPISLSGTTITYWTKYLGFEISAWSSEPSKDKEAHLMEYSKLKYDLEIVPSCCSVWCLPLTKKTRRLHKHLHRDEKPYVELTFGSTNNFCVRLQMLEAGSKLDIGTGHEKLMLSCSDETYRNVAKHIRVEGWRQGGSGKARSFQLVPGRSDLQGLIASDPNGIELMYYLDSDLRAVSTSKLDDEAIFRDFVEKYKKESEARKSKNKRGRYDSNIRRIINFLYLNRVC